MWAENALGSALVAGGTSMDIQFKSWSVMNRSNYSRGALGKQLLFFLGLRVLHERGIPSRSKTRGSSCATKQGRKPSPFANPDLTLECKQQSLEDSKQNKQHLPYPTSQTLSPTEPHHQIQNESILTPDCVSNIQFDKGSVGL